MTTRRDHNSAAAAQGKRRPPLAGVGNAVAFFRVLCHIGFPAQETAMKASFRPLTPARAIRLRDTLQARAAQRLRTACLLVAAIAAPPSGHAQPADYVLDPEHLTIAFLVDHVGFAKVLGRFETAEGTFAFDEQTGELSSLAVVVDTQSVSTQHRDRDRHLRGKDFLNSADHPRMSYTALAAQRTDERNFRVDGELELLGQTRPLTLHATWNKSGEYPFGDEAYAMGVSARGTFNRSDFGMTYGVDNGWVGDEVQIIIEFEAVRR